MIERIPEQVNKETRTPTEANRKHLQELLALLASKMDSVARYELYRDDAESRGKHDYARIYEDMANADRKHIEWLKEQVLKILLAP